MEHKIVYYKKEQENFPEKLREIPGPPQGIYLQGELPDPNLPSVAIVGARLCSSYGKKQAYETARYLSSFGVQIISGLARGIDGYAHEGALAEDGKTFAVLGCGLDYCYPPEHAGLKEKILQQQGGILSEYPICTPPRALHFPQRNRIISGLADLVLVVEAKEKSGSLITADCALEQGKNIYAVPGRVGDALSFGCNRLIAQGAGIAFLPECLLSELHIDKTGRGTKKEKINLGLASELNMVYSCLDFEPQNLDDICRKADMPIGRVSEILLKLELDGYIYQFSKNNYVKA